MIVGSSNEFEVSGSAVVSAWRTSVVNKSRSTIEFYGSTGVFYGIDDFSWSTGVFDAIEKTNVVGSTDSGVMESGKFKR